MMLTYVQPDNHYPNGAWYASAGLGDFEAIGTTPLAAAAALADVLEEAYDSVQMLLDKQRIEDHELPPMPDSSGSAQPGAVQRSDD